MKRLLAFALAFSLSYGAVANTVYTVTTGLGAGGSSTNIINFLFSKMADTSVVFDRRPGADNVVAANWFKQNVKPGDGTHLWMGGLMSTFVMADIMHPGQREYGPEDFEFVIGLGRAVSMVVASPASKSNTLKDIQQRAVAGERLNIGVVPGAAKAWAFEMTERLGTGQVVPYKSAADVGKDVLGGHVEFAVLNGSTAVSMHKQGLLKIIAVIGNQRLNDLPTIPTVKETWPGFGEAVDTTIVFAVPWGTDHKVIDTLHNRMKSIMLSPEGLRVWNDNQIFIDSSDLNRAVVRMKIQHMQRQRGRLEYLLK